MNRARLEISAISNRIDTMLASLPVIAIALAALQPVHAGDATVDVSDRPIFLPEPSDGNNVCEAEVNNSDASAFGFALPGPAITQNRKSAWVARFLVDHWQGQLKRVALPGSNAENQSHSVPAPDKRHVITYNPTSQEGVPFKWNELSDEQKEALRTPEKKELENTGQARLEYLRGDHSNEQRKDGPFRNRKWNGKSWELGDTVHSRPVIVGEPSFLYPETFGSKDNRYSGFVADQSSRSEIVYVGANDGMLHAFDSDTGKEKFAYLPSEDLKAGGSGGGLIFTRGKNSQLAELVPPESATDNPSVTDIVGDGNKDTKNVDITGPASGDFDGGGEPDIVYAKTDNSLRVIGGDFGKASIKLDLKGDKARTSKSRIAVGTFSDDTNDRIFYAGQDDNIYYVAYEGEDKDGNPQFTDPILAAAVSDNDGADGIAGFGDIDGDGRDELVYADSSQDPHFLERCDMAYTADCPSDAPSPGARRIHTPGGTPGSNNGLGIGNVFTFDGDARDTDGLLLTDGSNNIWIAYPKAPTKDDGARYAPDGSVSPEDQVEKGTKISDCGGKEAAGHCASKSPLTATDYDNDGEIEILYPGQDTAGQYDNKPLRALTPGEKTASSDAHEDAEVETIETDSGVVQVRDETGVVAGGGTGSPSIGTASLFERVSNLTDPDYSHEYFVDGSPTYGDVYLTGDKAWASVLAVPFGRGDQGLFAVDVTDDGGKLDDAEGHADDFAMWTFDDEDHTGVGNVVNKVSIVRLNNEDWAVAFGNGYGNTRDDGFASDHGNARLFLVDVETGNLIKTISTRAGVCDDPTVDSTTPDCPGGRANALGPVAPVDTDDDAIVDYIYAGDLFGNLWKFDLTAENKGSWTIVNEKGESQDNKGDNNTEAKAPLFTAENAEGDKQPITVRPSVVNHPGLEQDGVMIYFGTGVYIDDDHHSGTDEPTQSLYGIWDPMDDESQSYSRSGDGEKLLEQIIEKENESDSNPDLDHDTREISDNSIDWDTNTGWFLDLNVADGGATGNRGERLVEAPQFRNDKVLFNTIIPREERVCDKTNIGWLMRLKALNGGGTQIAVSASEDANGGKKSQFGSSTGGARIYVGPSGKPRLITSGHPGKLKGDDKQGLGGFQPQTSRDATGRQWWRQLR